MPEDKARDEPKKKKEKPRERKIYGNVRPMNEPECGKPGRPTYEHG